METALIRLEVLPIVTPGGPFGTVTFEEAGIILVVMGNAKYCIQADRPSIKKSIGWRL
jgi:hypothetical protein